MSRQFYPWLSKIYMASTLTEEECVQKWSSIAERLTEIDNLIKELAIKYENLSTETENSELVMMHHAAAFVMTELEKCNHQCSCLI